MTEDRHLCYLAACPACDADAWWHASAQVDPDAPLDLAITNVSYEIDCDACGPQQEVPRRAEPIVRASVSTLGWLGRTA